ncbi:hypothetical protein CFOL_v3_19199 [Cephalotus follicularis]|uniref:Uncharacterized protein n=1 Tax=Cephalotus follicularis TaxID=3775 RepID=A0A1Q3C6L6_CEPFO|nr:hypothetical protein CFOL_v3_19199 [Cephalotus follicularis]
MNVRCTVPDYPSRLTANYIEGTPLYAVGTFTDEHRHTVEKNANCRPHCIAKYVGALVETILRKKPTTITHEVSNFLKKYQVNMSYLKAWRAVEFAN